MAILFASGFDWTTSPLTDIGNFSGSNSNFAVGRFNGNSFYGVSGPTFANTTFIIANFAMTQPTQTAVWVASFNDTTSFKQVRLWINLDGTLSLYDSTGTILYVTGTKKIRATNWYWINWKVTIGIGGASTLFINGVLDHNVSVNTQTGSVNAYANSLQFGSTLTHIDDLFVLDGSGLAPYNDVLPDTHIFTGFPIFDIQEQWHTKYHGIPVPHWSVLDEVPNDGDTSYIYDDNVGDTDVFSISPNPKRFDSNMVQVNWVARKDAAGTREIQNRVNGVPGTIFTLTTSYELYQQLYLKEPFTGDPWTLTHTDNLQPGVQLAL